MAKKTAKTKTRISPKQRFDAYKTLALNTLRAVMSPKTRQFADLTSHEMVNGVLKPNTVQVSELISITQTAQALNNTVRLGYEGNGPKARLILTFVENVNQHESVLYIGENYASQGRFGRGTAVCTICRWSRRW